MRTASHKRREKKPTLIGEALCDLVAHTTWEVRVARTTDDLAQRTAIPTGISFPRVVRLPEPLNYLNADASGSYWEAAPIQHFDLRRPGFPNHWLRAVCNYHRDLTGREVPPPILFGFYALLRALNQGPLRDSDLVDGR
jgi:hypothetical protein